MLKNRFQTTCFASAFSVLFKLLIHLTTMKRTPSCTNTNTYQLILSPYINFALLKICSILAYLFYSQIFVYLVILSIFIFLFVYLFLITTKPKTNNSPDFTPTLFVNNENPANNFFVFNFIIHRFYAYTYYETFSFCISAQI